VHFPLQPANFDYLCAGVVAEVVPDQQRRNCEEIPYKWDICCGTPGNHIEL
jgi:hypothetical protein